MADYIQIKNGSEDVYPTSPSLQVCSYSMTGSISSGGSLTVDVASAVPDGKSIVSFLGVQIGNYTLPYMAQIGASKATYVETAQPGNKRIVIKDNGTTGWSNYTITVTFVVQ